MKLGSSLQHSQKPAIETYLVSVKSTPVLHILYLFVNHLNISTVVSQAVSYLLTFELKYVHCYICHARYIPHSSRSHTIYRGMVKRNNF
jgi:hypothetical protein